MKPRVLILILCYNGVADTLACLASLAQITYPAADLLVVDNASHDGTPAQVRAQFPHCTVIETGANLGFASGNNVGLRYAQQQQYDYTLLLNNDTEVAPDFLDRLVAVAESDPAIGIVGPTITYYEQPTRIWSAGGTIDWRRGRTFMRGIGEHDRGQYTAPTPVDFVTGAALLCKRAVLDRAGLLDDRFFMYYEETEWCVRAQRAGFRIMYVPDAKVLHKIPIADRIDKPYVAYYMTRNRLLFLQQTGAPLMTWLNALLFQDLRTCVSYTVRPKWRSRRANRDAMLRGLRDFALQRWGRLET